MGGEEGDLDVTAEKKSRNGGKVGTELPSLSLSGDRAGVGQV